MTGKQEENGLNALGVNKQIHASLNTDSVNEKYNHLTD